MSAWVIALGLSAGYLMNKQVQMGQRLDEKILDHHSRAAPANPGPPTAEIRRVQRQQCVEQDINVQELPAKDVKSIAAAQEAKHQEVAAFEAGPAPIQGVWLNVGDRGF